MPPAAADDGPKPVKPVNLDCNTKADEDDPFLSSSGYYLYYASNADKKFDLLVSKRSGGKWAAGKPLGGYVQTAADDRGAFLTSDGIYPQYLYYATKLDEKGDNFDLYVTYRGGAKQEFVPPEAVNVVDTPADEQDPWLTRDGKTLYFSRKTKDGYRVFTATRTSAKGAQGFADPAPVEELPTGFHHATLTAERQNDVPARPARQGPLGAVRFHEGREDVGQARTARRVERRLRSDRRHFAVPQPRRRDALLRLRPRRRQGRPGFVFRSRGGAETEIRISRGGQKAY